MQRPSGRTETVALVGASTVSGGAFITIGAGDDVCCVMFSLVCLGTAAVAAAIRQIAAHHERRIRALYKRLLRDHHRRQQMLARREAALDRREQRLQLREHRADLRVRSAQARLDQVLDERTNERLAHAELQVEYRELAREYNELALEAAGGPPRPEFQPDAVAVGQTVPAEHDRGSRRQMLHRGPRPVLKVVETVQDRQDSV
jgi:hypothetical protein